MSSVKSLNRAFKVDQAINKSTKEFVIIRFGVATDDRCKKIDELIKKDAAKVNQFADVYKVENNDVPELVARYNLSDDGWIIFFYKGTVSDRLRIGEIEDGKTFSKLVSDIREGNAKRIKDRLQRIPNQRRPITVQSDVQNIKISE